MIGKNVKANAIIFCKSGDLMRPYATHDLKTRSDASAISIKKGRANNKNDNFILLSIAIFFFLHRYLCYDTDMKESFEHDLRVYNELVKEAKAPEQLTKEGRILMQQKIDGVIADTIDRRIEHGELPEASIAEGANDAEMDVYKLQKEKQTLMEKFFKRTRGLEQGKTVENQGAPVVSFNQETRKLEYENEKGERISFTKEELYTDAEWGMHYTLDASVPYVIQKEYLVYELKRMVAEKLDAQIIRRETFSDRIDTLKMRAYEALAGRKENTLEQSGVIAEKMVKNLLKKISLVPGVEFSIYDADVYQDVEQKVDFIIKRTSHTRGARVKEDNTIGVQFTIAEGKLDKKEKQIAKAKEKISKNNDNGLMLDDLVVVHMPMNYAKKVYMEWKHNPRPGGPEKTLPVDIQETIITGVLQGLFREEEIKEIVAKTIERN
jgi:hypothetical protein